MVAKVNSKIPKREFLKSVFFLALSCSTNKAFSFKEKNRLLDEIKKDSGPRNALDRQQLALLGDICSVIIPQTETPSAAQVNTHLFIDSLIKDCLAEKQGHAIVRFLNEAQALFGIEHEMHDIYDFIESLDRRLQAGDTDDSVNAYKLIRELTIFGYYTSEIGASVELNYVAIPGRYSGSEKFSDYKKAWATIGIY